MTEEKVVYEGMCVGGPMDGETGLSRYPKGFLLVDKPGERAWVYDYDDEADQFVAREPDTLDTAKRLRAAEEFTYDVRAVDLVDRNND